MSTQSVPSHPLVNFHHCGPDHLFLSSFLTILLSLARTSTSALTAQASAPATTATLPFVHPFFSNRKQGTDPDVILESCDGGRFYVHSMLLRMRSAHFRTVFEMTPGRVHDGLPVLECQEETAATLKCLLPYFYAQAPDDLFLHNRKDAAISDYKNGLRFEDKFQMDVTEDSSGTDKDAWAMGCNTAKSKIEKSLQ